MRHESLLLRDAATRLDRALAVAARASGLIVTAIDHHGRPWASATFTGTQHAVTLRTPRAPALGRWVAELPDADLPLHGHLVASLAVDRIDDDGVEVQLTLTVLTIEAA